MHLMAFLPVGRCTLVEFLSARGILLPPIQQLLVSKGKSIVIGINFLPDLVDHFNPRIYNGLSYICSPLLIHVFNCS